VPGRLVGSAWGSDILVTPARGAPWRWLTRRVLRACALTTSDSQVMADRMRALGATDVMVFPFGLEAMPPAPTAKDPLLVFANRGLEPIYDPARVLQVFAVMALHRPGLRLVVANDGSLRASLEAQAERLGLGGQVQFVGRLDAATQALWYDRAQWFLSLPTSDSVAVSVLEAMAHGCIPLLSDLPANRELVRRATTA
jgi:glycosyltransferase involved in cell wall biosynthesis